MGQKTCFLSEWQMFVCPIGRKILYVVTRFIFIRRRDVVIPRPERPRAPKLVPSRLKRKSARDYVKYYRHSLKKHVFGPMGRKLRIITNFTSVCQSIQYFVLLEFSKMLDWLRLVNSLREQVSVKRTTVTVVFLLWRLCSRLACQISKLSRNTGKHQHLAHKCI